MSSVVDPPGRAPLPGAGTAPGEALIGEVRRPFLLTLWTDDPRLAASADAAGVDRVGLDLETVGKADRQSGLNTWISGHRVERLAKVRGALDGARLFARVNPLRRDTAAEVEMLLEHGVEVLMLPMFESAAQLAEFLGIVAGRATVVPLLETPGAVADIEEITALGTLGEIHIGLNDLALAMGLRNRFELLESPQLEHLGAVVRNAGLRLGIGGIGRLGDESLPIAPDLLYAQYVRLGSSCALLSRGYTAGFRARPTMTGQIRASRSRLDYWRAAGPDLLASARAEFRAALMQAPGW